MKYENRPLSHLLAPSATTDRKISLSSNNRR